MKTVQLTLTLEEAQLVVAALRQLPHQQVHDLVMTIWGEVRVQIQGFGKPTPTGEVNE
jgi:hypothetical protein